MAKARVPVNEAVEEMVWLFMVLEVAIVLIPDKAPAVVTFNPPDEVKVKVPVPLPIATLPEVEASVVPIVDEREVKAPVEAVVAPMGVELMPVAVVLKFEEVKVKAFTPVEIDEADKPDRVSAPEVAVRESAPVVKVRPLADVIVPEPVVEILLEVEMVLAVAIDPNPEAIEPEARAPTVVSDEVTTLEASVVPEISAAAFTVIVALGNVMVLDGVVGSAKAKVVVKASSVAPWKTKGEAPRIWAVTVSLSDVALPIVVLPLAAKSPVAVNDPGVVMAEGRDKMTSPVVGEAVI